MAKKGKDNARDKARQQAREAARRQAKKSRSRGSSTVSIPDGVEIYKPPENASETIAIIGYTVGKKRGLLADVDPGTVYYKASFRLHRNVGPEDKVVVCLKTFNKRCPICEEYNAIKQSGAEKEEYEPLKYKERDIFLVVHQGKLKLLEMPWYWLGKKIDSEIEEEEREGNTKAFWFPEDNLDVRITWETDSYGTKAESARFRKRKGEISDEVLERASDIDLGELVVEPTAEDILAIFHGTEYEGDGGDDGDDDGDGDGDGDGDDGAEETQPTDFKEMDAEELLEYAEDNEIEVPKKLRKKLKEDDEDEDALDELRELLAEEDGEPEPEDDPEPEPEDDPEDDDPPKKDKDKKGKKGDKGGGKKCPHKHTFGDDFDEYDDCDDCEEEHADTYKACKKANK